MRLINILKRSVLKMFGLIDKATYRFFRSITKVDKNLIIFEGQMGHFDESSWVLYHYLKKKYKYRFVWMVKNPGLYINTEDTKFVSRYEKGLNIKADYYYARAGYSFYTHTTSPIRYKRSGQMKIFIGHGYAIKGCKDSGRMIYNNFDYGLVMGVNAISTQSKFLNCDEKELLPLGLPRNDLLLRNNGQGKENPFVKRLDCKKVIIWMPTFRESFNTSLSESSCATDTGLPLFETGQQVVELNDYLVKCNCVVILKIHRLQLQKEFFKSQFSNIIFITDSDVYMQNKQLYELIGYSDALITDYSSVSVDYLLLNKPIGYILNDIEHYKKDRGFTSDNPLDVMAGDYLYDVDDCFKFISNVVAGKDNTSEQRKKLVQKLHAAPTGNSCELIEAYFEL